MSMLAFYWAYFPPTTNPAMRKALWSITAFVCLSYMAILWDDTFFCGKNVSVQWSQEDGACSVFYAPEPFILNFTLNLACYLCGMVVPLILIVGLFNVPLKTHTEQNISSLCSSFDSVDSRCPRAIHWFDSYFRTWNFDHHDNYCSLHHPESWHWPRELGL